MSLPPPPNPNPASSTSVAASVSACSASFLHTRPSSIHSLLHPSPLRPLQVRQLSNPRQVYTQLMEMLAQLAGLGLVHCDYNEFNLLVGDCCVSSVFFPMAGPAYVWPGGHLSAVAAFAACVSGVQPVSRGLPCQSYSPTLLCDLFPGPVSLHPAGH